ncbi:amino acid-binding protein [Vulcanisaeta distributa]|uniref:Amino acid-binding ACT domain protein n=1 Tax=Vulcanisaeta distributa (strain DSM 14429 / JCM 11212 / NBRC 100878 / IC-017) TaxID=572478 RepID=E1QQI5_VULDI|nr:amino acid-binding protein [Vulcanisaeta distributa]ADN50480.1 amino acid-binding ACT domain protein [Vulcanisaeta distributa DSM 14429]
MTWLLFRVVRDRPGIINELSSVMLNYGINIRNIIGNSRALMIDVEDNVSSLLTGMDSIRDIEFVNAISGPIIPLSFSQRHFMTAIKTVLAQMGTEYVGRLLYRIGYEYARAVATEMSMGDPVSTISTYLYTATAYNRLAFKGLVIRNNEVRVEFEEPFDEELDTALTQGYIHGLINTALSRLHYINIEKINNIYRAVARYIESIEPI